MIYLKLFLSFFKIGLFGIGGGYAIISLIENEVTENQWLTRTELTDIIAISQVTPGPISINAATYVGYAATDSILGAFVATSALIAPSLLICLTLCYLLKFFKKNNYIDFIFRSLRAVIVGMIIAVILFFFNKENFIDINSYIIFFFTLLLLFSFKKLNPIFIILLSGVLGLLLY
jgi:chromate transporter